MDNPVPPLLDPKIPLTKVDEAKLRADDDNPPKELDWTTPEESNENTGAEVIEKTITICHLTMAVFNTGHFKSRKVHINTKALKHLYDKKPAEEYDFIIHNLHLIIKFPDHIYKNKLGKIGDVVFAKKIDRVEYLCSLQFTTFTNPDSVIEEVNFAVTSYRKRDEDYLNGYKLLWSWEGGTPPS